MSRHPLCPIGDRLFTGSTWTSANPRPIAHGRWAGASPAQASASRRVWSLRTSAHVRRDDRAGTAHPAAVYYAAACRTIRSDSRVRLCGSGSSDPNPPRERPADEPCPRYSRRARVGQLPEDRPPLRCATPPRARPQRAFAREDNCRAGTRCRAITAARELFVASTAPASDTDPSGPWRVHRPLEHRAPRCDGQTRSFAPDTGGRHTVPRTASRQRAALERRRKSGLEGVAAAV